MTFCRMRCVRNCSSVLEFCLSRKSSALQATLVVISPREERGLKALKACTVFRKASSLILERQYHGSLVSESKGGLLRFTRKRQREAVYIKREDVVGNGLYFEERMFEPSEAKRSFYSLTSNFSSGLVNRKEEEIVGAVHAMVKTGEGSNSVTSQNTILEEVEQLLGSPLSCGSQAPPSKPLVIVISGPSGVGKDAVIKRLQEVRRELHFVVTATTRPKRPGEVDGKDYYFVSKEKFQSMIQKNELLEHAIVYGDYKGIPKQQVRECMAKGIDVVLRVDVQGAATVRSILGSSALFIFLVAESEYALVKRLIERKTETKDKLLVRISTARDEVKRMGEFDYVVVNADGQLERAVSLICSILDAEKARVQQRVAQI